MVLPTLPKPVPFPASGNPAPPPVDNILVNSVPTIPSLRGFTGQIANMVVIVSGNATIGDGGGGQYFWNPTDTRADNGTTVIAPTTGPGRWNLLTTSSVSETLVDLTGSASGTVVLQAKVSGDTNERFTMTASGAMSFGNGTSAPASIPNGQVLFSASGIPSGSSSMTWDNVNLRFGIGTSAPLVPLQIGPGTTIGTNVQVSVNALCADPVVGNGHAYDDETVITRSGTIAYASYDSNANTSGTNNYQHLIGYQSRPFHASSGTLTNWFGFVSIPNAPTGAGTITNAYQFTALADFTGTGSVTNNYGFFCPPLTRGANNWAFFVSGATKSQFATILFGTDNTYDIGASGATRPRSLYWGTQALGPDGTAANPGYGYAGEVNTGFYRSGAGQINMALTGVNAFQFTAYQIGFGNDTFIYRLGQAKSFGLGDSGFTSSYISGSEALIYGSRTLNDVGQIGIVGNVTTNTTVAQLTFHNDNIGTPPNRVGSISMRVQGANNTGRMDFVVWNAGASTQMMQIDPTAPAIQPSSDNGIDLGVTSQRWRTIRWGTQTLGPNGSTATPAYSFANKTTVGLFLSSTTGQGILTFALGSNLLSIDTVNYSANTLILTNTGAFAWGSGGASDGGTGDTFLRRRSGGIIQQSNLANNQQWWLYGTTDNDLSASPTNYERFVISTSVGTTTLGQYQGGTGVARSVSIGTTGSAALQFFTNNTNVINVSSAGNLLFNTDNANDIGASGATRPRSIYFGTQALGADGSSANPTYSFANKTGSGLWNNTASSRIELVSTYANGRNALTDGTSGFLFDASLQQITTTANTSITFTGLTSGIVITKQAHATNYQTLVVNNAADTALTASTERISVNFNLSATRTWATGALATQREFVIQAPTYAFAAASTLTTAATLAITGAPITGANATITNSYALWVQGGIANFAGTILIANGSVSAPSLAFAAATGNGLWSSGATDVSITAGGVRYFFESSTFGVLSDTVTFSFGASQDVLLVRDGAAGILALKNGSNAQTLRIYGTTTGPKYLFVSHDGTNGNVDTAASSGTLRLGTGNATAIVMGNGSIAVLPGGDNTNALGNSSNRWSNLSVAGSVIIGTNPASAGDIRLAYTGVVNTRNSTNAADFTLIDSVTVNAVVNLVRMGNNSAGCQWVFRTGAADPTTSDIPSGFTSVYQNTTTGTVSLWANKAGTLVKIALA